MADYIDIFSDDVERQLTVQARRWYSLLSEYSQTHTDVYN